MSAVFYKYRSASAFTDQIFTNGQVYLSNASGLNDPFECSLQEIGRDWINEQVNGMKQAGVAGFIMTAKRALDNGEDFFGRTSSQIEDLLEEIPKSSGIEGAYRWYVEFIRDATGYPPSDCDRLFSGIDAQLNSVGIFSMSARADHPLMWAHYAQEHTGICIGFEKVNGLKMEHQDHFLPVVYSDSLPELSKNGFQTVMAMSAGENGRIYTSSFKIAFSDKTFQAAVTTKPTCWNYEEEWRYIEPYPGLFDWPGRITELTFGLKCSDDARNRYIQLAEDHIPNEVLLYEMRKRYGTNALERCEYHKTKTQPKSVKAAAPADELGPVGMSAEEFVAKMERLIRQENYGDALFQIGENLKLNPGSPILLHLKGVAHGYARQPQEAFECFKQLTVNFPRIGQGWYQLSCALEELGKDKEAIEALRKAAELDPNDASVAFNLGVQLYKHEQAYDEALVWLHRAERLGHRRARQAIVEIESP